MSSLRQALGRLLAAPAFQRLEARLRQRTAFDVLGIATRELSHAGLLAWLLDPRAAHGLSDQPLRTLLLLAADLAPESDHRMLDAVDVDGLDLLGAYVTTEHSIQSGVRRLDVLVSRDLNGAEPLLVVEYKVDAEEGTDQTADYAAWAQEHPLRGGPWVGVDNSLGPVTACRGSSMPGLP